MRAPHSRLRSSLLISALACSLLATGCASAEPPPRSETAGPDVKRSPESGNVFGNIETLSGSEEWQSATEEYDRCMLEYGWASREGPGGMIFGFPEGQEDAFAASDRQCNISSGRDDIVAEATLTTEELQDGHDWAVALTKCLTDNGYEVPPAPTLQAFIELEGGWSPYLFLQGNVADEAMEVCPQQLDQ